MTASPTPLLRALLLVLIAAAPLQAQDAATRLRLAQGHEQAGNFEQALRLYEDLHRREPGNVVFFEGLKRTYLQLKRYTEAASLLRGRLTGGAADIPLLAQLGGVHYRAGEDSLASAAWDAAVDRDPGNISTYRVVTAVLMENRLLDRTAALYRAARVACKDPNLFTQELAGLLAVSMDYTGAATEYVRLLRTAPQQLGFVQGRMAGFTGTPEARAAAIAVVRAELRRTDDLQLLRLLGWLELEGRDYSAAFETHRALDRATRAQGGELYAFAERAVRDRAYADAARAYEEAIAAPIQPARMPYARYGLAVALKEVASHADSATPLFVAPPPPPADAAARFARPLRLFREIIADYPRSEFSARSHYQIGLLQADLLGEPDAALASFEAVGRELPALTILRYDVALRSGQVLVLKGDTAQAAVRFASVAAAADATPDQQDEAAFRLAELDFFRGAFSRALTLLNGISVNVQADYANDALALASFLQQNTGQDSALRTFAAGELQARRRNLPEALSLFTRVLREHPRAPLAADALLRVGGLQVRTGRTAEALASFDRLLADFSGGGAALDRARFSIAEIHQFILADTAKAIAAYEAVLAEHPRSLLTTPARKRIRELRGDTL